jgi:hypothetical protein
VSVAVAEEAVTAADGVSAAGEAAVAAAAAATTDSLPTATVDVLVEGPETTTAAATTATAADTVDATAESVAVAVGGESTAAAEPVPVPVKVEDLSPPATSELSTPPVADSATATDSKDASASASTPAAEGEEGKKRRRRGDGKGKGRRRKDGDGSADVEIPSKATATDTAAMFASMLLSCLEELRGFASHHIMAAVTVGLLGLWVVAGAVFGKGKRPAAITPPAPARASVSATTPAPGRTGAKPAAQAKAAEKPTSPIAIATAPAPAPAPVKPTPATPVAPAAPVAEGALASPLSPPTRVGGPGGAARPSRSSGSRVSHLPDVINASSPKDLVYLANRTSAAVAHRRTVSPVKSTSSSAAGGDPSLVAGGVNRVRVRVLQGKALGPAYSESPLLCSFRIVYDQGALAPSESVKTTAQQPDDVRDVRWNETVTLVPLFSLEAKVHLRVFELYLGKESLMCEAFLPLMGVAAADADADGAVAGGVDAAVAVGGSPSKPPGDAAAADEDARQADGAGEGLDSPSVPSATPSSATSAASTLGKGDTNGASSTPSAKREVLLFGVNGKEVVGWHACFGSKPDGHGDRDRHEALGSIELGLLLEK